MKEKKEEILFQKGRRVYKCKYCGTNTFHTDCICSPCKEKLFLWTEIIDAVKAEKKRVDEAKAKAKAEAEKR